MKYTKREILQTFPFLRGLLSEIKDRVKVSIKVDTTGHLKTLQPYNEGVIRYISCGKISDNDSCYVPMAKNTTYGYVVSVQPGIFKAQLDIHEKYGMRELTVWLTEADFNTLETAGSKILQGTHAN